MGDEPAAPLIEAARAYRAAFGLLQVALAVAADQPGAGMDAWVAQARDTLDAAQAGLCAAALALERGPRPLSPAEALGEWLGGTLAVAGPAGAPPAAGAASRAIPGGGALP